MKTNPQEELPIQVSVVIPVYNGADTIVELITRLEKVLSENFDDYEIIMVEDRSPDDSWELIQTLCASNRRIRGIQLMRNSGQHNAVLCGIRAARFPITLTMDDDLQHPPEQIPLLLAEYRKGFDVVYAIPRKLPHSWWRNLGSRLTKVVLSKIMQIPIQDIGSFRIFRTKLRDAFADYRSAYVYIDPLLAWGTSSFSHVTVEEDPRRSGKSNYTFSSLVKAGLLILTGYSTVPLRLASGLGFIFMAFGFGVLLYVLAIAIGVGSVPGFPFLASIIALFAGVQLFTLGIIGEYLARVYESSTQRPPYNVAAAINEPKEQNERPE